MDLVERYIEAIKFWLPKRLKEDVAAEIREDIRSEIEDAERQKGRPLTEEEVSAILKARGAPMSVASRYMPQRWLIGPELYPLYIFVLKIVAVICIIPPFLTWIGELFADPFAPGLHNFVPPFNGLLVSFAITTIVFAVMDYKGVHLVKANTWNPKSLRRLSRNTQIKRSESVGEIIVSLVIIGLFAAGYLSQTRYQFVNADVTFCPQWILFWHIVIATAVAEIALSAANLFKPYWSGFCIFLRAVIDAVKMAAFYQLIAAHMVREITITGAPPETAAQIMTVSDMVAQYAVPAAAVVGIVIVAKALWRTFNLFHRQIPVPA